MTDLQRKPHVHAALIKAWADGAEIEALSEDSGPNGEQGNSWKPIANPFWHPTGQYRIKPRPHKWQKEMDAYAAGGIIEHRVNRNGVSTSWKICRRPVWGQVHPDVTPNQIDEYRIKPEEVVSYGLVSTVNVGNGQEFDVKFSFPSGKCKTRVRQDNLKLTFKDGTLIAAEVLV